MNLEFHAISFGTGLILGLGLGSYLQKYFFNKVEATLEAKQKEIKEAKENE